MKTKILILILLIACNIIVVPYCYGGKVRVIEGVIEKATDDSVAVNGKYYDVTKVQIVDASGTVLKKSELKTDKRIKLFFNDGDLTSILIYEYILE